MKCRKHNWEAIGMIAVRKSILDDLTLIHVALEQCSKCKEIRIRR